MQVQRRGLVTMVLLAATLLLAAPSRSAAQDFFIKDGDRIVMMGDSITEQHLYSNYVEMWTVSRFPAWKLTFRNVGIGGDRSVGGNSRFKRDVLAYNPTVLTVDFGMNDGGYQPFNPKLYDPYMKGLQGIADQAKAAGIRVAWITPQPIEHYPGEKKESYNETLEKFSAGVKEIAQKNSGLFVDQFHPYWAVIQKARESGQKIRITAGDAVHPGPPGQALMAASILKGMNFPTQVARSELEVDLPKRTITYGRIPGAGSISEARISPDHVIRFQRTDTALPFFPPEAKGILKWAPLLTDMNDYHLTVKGLKSGMYEIRMGDKKVAQRSAAELAKGVNLAAEVLANGPIADQVKKVWQAIYDKNKYFHDQIFRGVVLAGGNSPIFKGKDKKEIDSTRQALYEQRMMKMPELDAAVREALTMRPYVVEIAPVK